MKLRIVASIPKRAGWWLIGDDGVCGDRPADILGDYLEEHTVDEATLDLQNPQSDLHSDIEDAWMEEVGRVPSAKELTYLLKFCGKGSQKVVCDHETAPLVDPLNGFKPID
jgi:hypothetical protein